jgi:6,7-dimethyl-8-ribityllumazine synthase
MTTERPTSTPASWSPKVIEGRLDGRGMRIALVCARFNDLITERLLTGAQGALRRHGVAADDVTVVWVPGAVEIPLVTRQLAGSGEHDAVICLGAVIRGATGHYDQVANAVTSGLQRVSLDSGVPVVFGVLTVETIEQAIERAGTKAGNKGEEAAVTAIEVVDVLRAVAKGE